MKTLEDKYKNYTFELIVGSEIIDDYIKWENFEELRDECKFIILERPDKNFNEFNLPKHYRTLKISIDLGDQDIKKRIGEKKQKKANFGINGLTSRSVIKYIQENGLYQNEIKAENSVDNI
jgi:nicotinic acid mononucleotide adenylyltransferase